MDKLKYKQYSGYIRFVLKAAFENYKDASRFYDDNIAISAYDYYWDLLDRISNKTGFTPVQITDIANLTDENLNTKMKGINTSAAQNNLGPKTWYAVQTSIYDAWDNGSYDLNEAYAIAANARECGAEFVKIAIIENGDYCADEIDFDDVVDMR